MTSGPFERDIFLILCGLKLWLSESLEFFFFFCFVKDLYESRASPLPVKLVLEAFGNTAIWWFRRFRHLAFLSHCFPSSISSDRTFSHQSYIALLARKKDAMTLRFPSTKIAHFGEF